MQRDQDSLLSAALIMSSSSFVALPPRECLYNTRYLQDHKGGGIVHFRTRDDMDYALRKLDGSDFRNPFEKSRISVRLAFLSSMSLSLLLHVLFPSNEYRYRTVAGCEGGG